MNEETRIELGKRIEILWKERPRIGVADTIDLFIEVACGNCEISCNESNCDKRHNN